MKLDRLSPEYIGDFAEAASLAPPRVVFALYDEPKGWREMMEALEGELRFFEARVIHLECGRSAGADLVEKWMQALRSAGPDVRVFVADELSALRDDRFELLFRALEERREVVISANKGVFLLSVTPERVAEIARCAPGFYTIADVVLLSEDKFRVPDDPAYGEDRARLETELQGLERKYAFTSDQLWERMASGKCLDVPEEDLRRWERLLEALRQA